VRIESHLADCTVCCALVAASPPDGVLQLIATARRNAPPPSSPPLRVVAGFEVLDVLGRGGMGVVYRARQIGLDRIVALKRLRVGALANGEDLLRFRREAVALARVQHPNIVQIHDAGDQDGHPYLALEFVPGPSLREWLDRSPLPVQDAARLLAILARAVDFAHRHGIVHRDLKPGNVLLAAGPAVQHPTDGSPTEALTAEDGTAFPSRPSCGTFNPKITDFGLARLLDVGADVEQTRSGALMGTPGYMAPELSRASAKQIGPAVDIYSLGAILYEALTGRPPFLAATAFATLELADTHDPPSPRRLQPCVPRDLETICMKCLRHDAAARYRTAADLAEDLHAFLGGRPIAARPVGRVENSWKWIRRRPALAALCFVAVVAVCAAVTGTLAYQQKLRRQTEHAERNYRDAWRTIQGLLLKFEDPRAMDAGQHDQLRREQLRDAIPFFENILAETSPANIELRTDRLTAHLEMSRLCHELGRSSDAAQHLDEAIGALEALTADPAVKSDDLSLLGECYTRAATIRHDAGDLQGWRDNNIAAANVFERVVALQPAGVAQMLRLAECWMNVGFAYRDLNQFELAARSHARAHKLRRDVWELDRESSSRRCELAEVCFHQIDVYRLYNADAVPGILREVDQLLTPLAASTFSDQRIALQVSRAFFRWGQIMKTENSAAAVEKFDVTQRVLDDYLQRDPNSRQASWHLADAHSERAWIADSQGRHAEAIRHWDRAVDLAPDASQLLNCRVQRALSLIRYSDRGRATQELEALLSEPALSAAELVFLARNAAESIVGLRNAPALSGVSRVESSNRIAELAVGLLGKAVELGYLRDHRADDLIAENPMFESLRMRDDFIAVLEQLEYPKPK
jgi:serine/threonine protein kinase/tetratricopeptide (TPR) repeat protein